MGEYDVLPGRSLAAMLARFPELWALELRKFVDRCDDEGVAAPGSPRSVFHTCRW